MTVEALAEKLRDMRADPDLDLTMATILFGIIFHREIGDQSGAIVAEYSRRKDLDELLGGDWPGDPAAPQILSGRKLGARYVDPHWNLVQRWKP